MQDLLVNAIVGGLPRAELHSRYCHRYNLQSVGPRDELDALTRRDALPAISRSGAAAGRRKTSAAATSRLGGLPIVLCSC